MIAPSPEAVLSTGLQRSCNFWMTCHLVYSDLLILVELFYANV